MTTGPNLRSLLLKLMQAQVAARLTMEHEIAGLIKKTAEEIKHIDSIQATIDVAKAEENLLREQAAREKQAFEVRSYAAERPLTVQRVTNARSCPECPATIR